LKVFGTMKYILSSKNQYIMEKINWMLQQTYNLLREFNIDS